MTCIAIIVSAIDYITNAYKVWLLIFRMGFSFGISKILKRK